MKKIILYLATLMACLIIGIAGELFIPERYSMNLTSGCIRSNVTGVVFLPDMFAAIPIQKPTDTSQPLPLYAPDLNWKSYRLALEFLIRRVSKLSQEECNKYRSKIK